MNHAYPCLFGTAVAAHRGCLRGNMQLIASACQGSCNGDRYQHAAAVPARCRHKGTGSRAPLHSQTWLGLPHAHPLACRVLAAAHPSLLSGAMLMPQLVAPAAPHAHDPVCLFTSFPPPMQVYRVTVQPLVHTLFHNGKATCFAYGQTGSGKTFTMSPLPIRAAADILAYLQRPELRDVELYVSCFEIYGNKVFDLLNMRKKLNILEDGKKKVCVVGLKVSLGRSFAL